MRTMRATNRFRAMRLLALLALTIALALSACGAPGRQSLTNGSGDQATTQQQTSALSASVLSVRSADQSVQDAVSALQSASSDASTDFASQDVAVQP
jgi:uncharacterized lipoprotein YajG